jgi:hypothetical protein
MAPLTCSRRGSFRPGPAEAYYSPDRVGGRIRIVRVRASLAIRGERVVRLEPCQRAGTCSCVPSLTLGTSSEVSTRMINLDHGWRSRQGFDSLERSSMHGSTSAATPVHSS